MQQGDNPEVETRSVCSGPSQKSSRSSKSSVSMAAIKARARAEAARARAVVARKEIELKVKQAKLKVEETQLTATLDVLKEEKEAEAALAEANVFEAAAADEELTSEKQFPSTSVQRKTNATNNYGNTSDDIRGHVLIPEPNYTPQTNVSHWLDTLVPDFTPVVPPHPINPFQIQKQSNAIFNENRLAPVTVSKVCSPSYGNNEITNLAKYLAKRDLITDGLSKFTDKPEDYWAWKGSFQNTIEGLSLKPSEELDLLIRWLGEDSSKHAKRVRSVHINHPEAGLKMVWERLEECFGTPEAIEEALLKKLEHFPKIFSRESQKLQDLGDLLMEIDFAKRDGYLPGLLYLDTARGIAPVVDKLPLNLQDKWMSEGTKYKNRHNASFPPFSFFSSFIQGEAKMRSDPSFKLTSLISTSITTQSRSDFQAARYGKTKTTLAVHKTDVNRMTFKGCTNTHPANSNKYCVIHNKPHPLRVCRAFREKPLEDRKALLREHNICYRCCESTSHQAKNCIEEVKCSECNSERHIAALHAGPAPWAEDDANTYLNHGGEEDMDSMTANATSTCTQVCGDRSGARSCSKICLVSVYPAGRPENKMKAYAIMDDQSNRSLAKSAFFDAFGIPQDNVAPYTLKTCTGVSETSGRRARNFIIESADGKSSLQLPTLIECNTLPDNRSEIPTPDVAYAHRHLKHIASKIPPLDSDAHILLLLGRDIIQAHKVKQQFSGPVNAPFAQRLTLGWVIVGEVCLGGAHKSTEVGSFRTHVLENGRPSLFSPCQNNFQVKEQFWLSGHPNNMNKQASEINTIGKSIFQQSENDEKLALSLDNQAFLDIMEAEFHQNSANSWVAPLPFRSPRHRLPNNKALATSRLNSLRRTLKKRPELKEHIIDFMQGLFDNHHAEPAPPLTDNEECWYLPFFGIYHPQKPGNIRVVFDSSAKFQGVSLNDVLLTGPNLNNSLVGVLIRFREESVAVTADIQQMFHCFLVREDHRNFLRFLWFHNNNPEERIVEYRMTVHVFGNSPSPAVAIFGLNRAADQTMTQRGQEAKCFIDRHFYVDDGLKSVPTEMEAINLLKETQDLLGASNLRLHKIASNKPKVMMAFPREDLASGLKDLDLSTDFPPLQRSLGVSWDITQDTFAFKVSATEKPYTKRGVLSTINSVFDPLGFAAPVSIRGRALLRELASENREWDDPLPKANFSEWQDWRNSLKYLEEIRIPRSYASVSLVNAQHKEICIFCDASTQAIAAVAFLKMTTTDGKVEVAFMFGKAKLAPKPASTIPRLELCAAVLAVEIADMIKDEMDVQHSGVRFFSDSRVVLGYIHNETRRFHVYVSNRVQRIRQSSQPEQWNYVPTDQNPADHGTRSLPAVKLSSSTWLNGPGFLCKPPEITQQDIPPFDLIKPDADTELRPLLTSITQASPQFLSTKRLLYFSSWRKLTRAVARLVHVAHVFKTKEKNENCKGWHMCNEVLLSDYEQAKMVIIKAVQGEAFPKELELLKEGKELHKSSPLRILSPYLDEKGMLRVGGRLSHSDLQSDEKNPFIIPRKHHISDLLIRYHHEKVCHQGRHLTEGALRSGGYWILGGKRQISSIIHSCVTCRKLRGGIQTQKMAELPVERLSTEPPFTYVGVDAFGPWVISSRRTRGGLASSKRWAVLFTCMSIRAVHLEVIESMDTSCFINALRRFFAIRGPVKQLRSDCGTNFVGASRELGLHTEICTEPSMKAFLKESSCTWIFNPPHSSHMGGSWERMIGVARRILDSLLGHLRPQCLTHEVLTTLMAEVTAIMNARPLVPVSSDPDSPLILTPATLLTQKIGTSPPPLGEFEERDLYGRQWRRVQSLANTFWHRWRREYLPTLQKRKKWHDVKRNLQEGDLVLLKDAQANRNHWPMGVVVKTYPSRDGLIRKADVKTVKDGTCKIYLRPITDMVLLLPDK